MVFACLRSSLNHGRSGHGQNEVGCPRPPRLLTSLPYIAVARLRERDQPGYRSDRTAEAALTSLPLDFPRLHRDSPQRIEEQWSPFPMLTEVWPFKSGS